MAARDDDRGITRFDLLVADVGRRAMGDFRPAAPLTLEGLFFGLIGFAAGASAMGIAALPMGRRKPKPAPASIRRTAP